MENELRVRKKISLEQQVRQHLPHTQPRDGTSEAPSFFASTDLLNLFNDMSTTTLQRDDQIVGRPLFSVNSVVKSGETREREMEERTPLVRSMSGSNYSATKRDTGEVHLGRYQSSSNTPISHPHGWEDNISPPSSSSSDLTTSSTAGNSALGPGTRSPLHQQPIPPHRNAIPLSTSYSPNRLSPISYSSEELSQRDRPLRQSRPFY